MTIIGGSSLSSVASPNSSTFSKTSSWSHVGHSVSASTCEKKKKKRKIWPQYRIGYIVNHILTWQRPPKKPFECSHLGDLALCWEEDSCEGIRQTCAVGSKQASSLVHVDPQLKDLLHCGQIQTLIIQLHSICGVRLKTFVKTVLELS